MSRIIPDPRLLLFWVLLIATQAARAQDVQPPSHPNSYIVLVDASGSTERSGDQKRLYEQVLRERLIPALYQKGFGAVPPYDPQQDELTLYRFGVVTGDAATAYRRLAACDLLSDLTHPVFVREKAVDAERLKASIAPAQTYQYTLLSWVKQLALERSRPERPGEVRQHTFIIMIHDGLPNENSARGEIDMLRRWAGPNYEKYGKLVEAIDRDYQFTDSGGAPAYSEEIKGDTVGEGWSFFIEAYEVVSKAEADWEEHGRRLRPLDGLSLRWVDTSGETPRGVLTATPSEEFKRWADSAGSREVSLVASPDDSAAGTDMEVPVTLSRPLTCDPPSLNTTLRATLRRSDSLLGDRTINYTYTQTVETPAPFRCTAISTALNFALVLLAAAALLGIAYFFHYRFRATHLRLFIPGTMTPIRLGRSGRREGFAAVVPQSGLEALSVEVPGRLRRWFFYRRATVTLSSADGTQPLRWLGEGGSAELKFPQARGRAPAYWWLLPSSSSEITVTFRQGKQSSSLILLYPRALAGTLTGSPIMNPDRHDDIVYVSLDLGSESMAAYYEDMHGRHGMIQLQAYADKLLTNGGSDKTLALLQEADGKPSPRLWNRISFKINGKQPAEPGPDHAKLCFITSPKDKTVSVERYEESLFNFFHPLGGWPPDSRMVMPNPKILFQQQVTDVLDEIKVPASDSERVSLRPEMLINHLTLQVIINFVLNSAELSRYRREDVHLTITVPNVYSLPHAESIKEFVRTNVGSLAGVEVLSESDAVTYYALRAVDQENDPPELIKFKEAWTKQLELSQDVCFVTIDVGKGTTDLSCILVQNPPSQRWRLLSGGNDGESSKKRRHSVQGKTGRSSGGTYLNYILAGYYDARLKEAVAASPADLFTNAPFGFIVKDASQLQQRALTELENLIEHVKRGMTEAYEIDEALLSTGQQREMAAKVVDFIIRGFANLGRFDEIPAGYNDFRARAINALLLPPRLVEPEETTSVREALSGLGISAFFRRWLARIRGTAPPPAAAAEPPATPAVAAPPPAGGDGLAPTPVTTPHTEKLRRDIEGYVAENVGELLDSLKNLVSDHQAIADNKGKSGIDGAAFVIISGQASQFRPLRAAIIKKCEAMGVEREHILPMTGVDAKEACCKGVVNFWVDGMETTNPKELHGTYGCLDRATGTFKPFNMRRVKSDGKDTITFEVESAYWVVFTPRAYEETEVRPPQLNDGATARLRLLRNQSKFELEYNPDRLELTVNGERLMISSFGSPDGSIYKKVWPEILQPHN